MLRSLLISISFLFLLNSCSIKKRSYRKGYHVDWAFHQKKTKSRTFEIPKEEYVLVASSDSKLNTSDFIKKEEKCGDSLFLKNGEVHLVSILELNSTHLLCKKCDAQPEKIHKIERSKLYKIRYSNGKIKEFEPKVNETCKDLIVTKTGTKIKAKIHEVNSHNIAYKKCDGSDSNLIYLDKAEINEIIYSNGSVDSYREPVKIMNEPKKKRKLHPLILVGDFLAIASWIVIILYLAFTWDFGIIGLLGVMVYLVGIVMAIIGFIRSKKHKEKYHHSLLFILSFLAPLIGLLLSILTIYGMGAILSHI